MRLRRYDWKSYESSIRDMVIAEFQENTYRIHRLDIGCERCDRNSGMGRMASNLH